MKNCKKRNTCFYPRTFGIALVTMLTATTLWAKPKVEYTPFKSENPNASVYECEYIPEYSGSLYLVYDISDLSYDGRKVFYKEAVNFSSIAVYGWKKKKGGWEKLGEYQLDQSEYYMSETVLNDGSNQYTHYAVEIEAPENSLTFSAKKFELADSIKISIEVSKDYKKRIDEKREAEEAEQDRLAKEELFNKYKTADAELKKKSKGYEFHGISEYYKTYRLLNGKSLTNGHAYVSKLRFSNNFSRAEFYETEWIYNNFINLYKGSVYLQYADNSLREQIVLLERNSNDEVWFCYTPNSSGDITILGFVVTKDHSSLYGASEKNLTLYAEWLAQGN